MMDSSSLLRKVECQAPLHKALGRKGNTPILQQIETLQRETLGKKEAGEGGEALATAHHLPDPKGQQRTEAQLDCNCCHVFLI